MEVLCKVSEREWLRLNGISFPTLVLDDEYFAILFNQGRLYLPSPGEHAWRFFFPDLLKGIKQDLFIEEHPHQGDSRRIDRLPVVKTICNIGGQPLSPVTGNRDKYLARSLATISRYCDGTTTIKELRVRV